MTWTLGDSLVYAGRLVSSADGSKLALQADIYPQNIYTSTNSGATWALAGAPPMGNWGNDIRGLVSSADGDELTVLFTSATSNGIYVSTNGGATWLCTTNLNENWSAATCSANGTKIAAITSGDGSSVFVSTNSGVSWQPAAPMLGQSTSGILSTADGSELIAPISSGLYISTNWGASWSCTNNSLNEEITCSADGSLLLGQELSPVYGNEILTSTNLGVTWTSNSVPQEDWAWVACSADGNKLVATAGYADNTPATNGIWVSQTPPSPRLNLSYSSNNLNFSWLIPSTNMVMQESPDLINWTILTNQPVLNYTNLQEQLTLSPTNASAYFRLISQ